MAVTQHPMHIIYRFSSAATLQHCPPNVVTCWVTMKELHTKPSKAFVVGAHQVCIRSNWMDILKS